MDPIVGSTAVSSDGGLSNSSDNADLLDFCFLCSRQFFHESLDDYGTERLKDEEILETFFEELGPVDRSLLCCCPACKGLCKTVIRTKDALSSLIDKIINLLLRSRKVSYLLPKSRVVSRLFQSSNSSLPPCETSTSYLQQPLSQINFSKETSNNNCFPTQFDLKLDSSNLSVCDSLDLGLPQSITTSVIKRSPLAKARHDKDRSKEVPPFNSSTTFSSIFAESIMNSVSDNACDISEGVIMKAKSAKNPLPQLISLKQIEDVDRTKPLSMNSKECDTAIKKSLEMQNLFSDSRQELDCDTSVFSDLQISKLSYKRYDLSTAGKAVIINSEVTSRVSLDSGNTHFQPSGESDVRQLEKVETFTSPILIEEKTRTDTDNSDDEVERRKKRTKRKSNFHCDTCDKSFQTARNLRNHVSAHNQERKYICEICGISYRHKAGLEAHVAIHNGESQFHCELCGKAFTQKSGLQRHLRIHTGKHQFQCDTCGKQFLHHTSFSAHKVMHEGVRKFACEQCSATFGHRSHLQRHMKVHSGEKPFVCGFCGRSFAENYNLQVHLKSHQDATEAPHKCSKCKKGFTRKFKLKKHMAHVHGLKGT